MVVDDVQMVDSTGFGIYDVNAAGMLVYARGYQWPADRELVWMGRNGAPGYLATPDRRPFIRPALSPDGARIAVTVEGTTSNLWIYEASNGRGTPLTVQQDDNDAPVWSTDGRALFFSSNRDGPLNIFRVSWGPGTEKVERLTSLMDTNVAPLCVTAGGATLLFGRQTPQTGRDILSLAIDSRETSDFLATPGEEYQAQVSPDGRWLAYTSNDSGRDEVYLRQFAGPAKWRVSDQGSHPVWGRDGRELFYRAGSDVMAVAVPPGSFRASAPRVALSIPADSDTAEHGAFDVSTDGKRFLVVRALPRPPRPTDVVIVPNWGAELTGKR